MTDRLEVPALRAQFPALHQTAGEQPVVFLDNPGGTQVLQAVIDALSDYLIHHNANHGGAFATSQRSDEMLCEAHGAMADLLNASAIAKPSVSKPPASPCVRN